jgi:NitT/TauT family transport system substrate-binding protein
VTDILLDRTLGHAGLTRDDVQIVELPYPDMNAALGSRAVDLALHNEPFVSVGENLGVLRRWRPVTDVTSELYTGVWLYSPGFAGTEAARRFVVGYLRGVRDYNDAIVHGRGKPAVVDILTRQTSVKDARLYDQMAFAAIDPDGRVLPERLAEDVQYYVSKGYMTQPMDVRQVLDQQYVDYALSRLGPYRPPS